MNILIYLFPWCIFRYLSTTILTPLKFISFHPTELAFTLTLTLSFKPLQRQDKVHHYVTHASKPLCMNIRFYKDQTVNTLS